MKLTELQAIINEAVRIDDDPEDKEVVITVRYPYATAGSRPSVGVKYASLGFDWEHRQFRIEPDKTLMCCKHNTPQLVAEWNGTHICPYCGNTLSKTKRKTDIKYCNRCGTAVRWE